jgi:hypothetical protein
MGNTDELDIELKIEQLEYLKDQSASQRTIAEHLWWLALIVKIALVMIVLQFIFLLAFLA